MPQPLKTVAKKLAVLGLSTITLLAFGDLKGMGDLTHYPKLETYWYRGPDGSSRKYFRVRTGHDSAVPLRLTEEGYLRPHPTHEIFAELYEIYYQWKQKSGDIPPKVDRFLKQFPRPAKSWDTRPGTPGAVAHAEYRAHAPRPGSYEKSILGDKREGTLKDPKSIFYYLYEGACDHTIGANSAFPDEKKHVPGKLFFNLKRDTDIEAFTQAAMALGATNVKVNEESPCHSKVWGQKLPQREVIIETKPGEELRFANQCADKLGRYILSGDATICYLMTPGFYKAVKSVW